MIITDISAENVLKYARLELKDLPESGIIAIQGPNESGKSTVGETVCFALFGRTFSLDAEELDKLIRWGESRCSVSLRFRPGDGEHYEIARFLDREGNQGARLNLVGQEKPMARGVEAVENRLYELLGYGFEEFIESFYLAQREITTPHPHSYAIKAMAGISTLEYLSDDYAGEIELEQEAVEEIQQQTAGLEQELEALAVDPELLPALEAERDGLAEEDTRALAGVGELEDASTVYQESLPSVRGAAGRRRWARFLGFLSFLLAAELAADWWLITRMPDHDLTRFLTSVLSGWIPAWNEQYVPWLLYGAIAFAFLFLVFWMRSAALTRSMTRLRESAETLADRIRSLHRERSTQPADSASATDSAEDASPTQGEDESTVEPTVDVALRPDEDEAERLCQRIVLFNAETSEVMDLVSRERAWVNLESRHRQELIGGLEERIQTENERLRKAGGLQQGIEGLQEKTAGKERVIHLRELARELLDGATRQLSHRFNHDLRDLVGRTLPLFTEERYEHLQIDDELTVRVFSKEKRDFMDLEEISSGTQRQIMLAVRLALSQELVRGAVEGKQFVFLDEPFAFFDRERTLRSLQVLPGLSDEITQIWIVSQEFPEGQDFDLSVTCARDKTAI